MKFLINLFVQLFCLAFVANAESIQYQFYSDGYAPFNAFSDLGNPVNLSLHDPEGDTGFVVDDQTNVLDLRWDGLIGNQSGQDVTGSIVFSGLVENLNPTNGDFFGGTITGSLHTSIDEFIPLTVTKASSSLGRLDLRGHLTDFKEQSWFTLSAIFTVNGELLVDIGQDPPPLTGPGGGGEGEGESVPEPATALLVSVASLFASSSRRRNIR